MPRVTIELPSLLAAVLNGRRHVTVEAETLDQSLDRLIESHPGLRVHLFDESGDFREHVLCFLNETSTRWMESRKVPVAEGDTITILQAVSGG